MAMTLLFFIIVSLEAYLLINSGIQRLSQILFRCKRVNLKYHHIGWEYQYLPSLGAELMSSFISLVTSLSRTTPSSAQPLWARVISCLIAVRKPWGLKKPVIQKQFGRHSKIQSWNWVLRSSRSVNQKPSVADSQEICVGRKGQHNIKYVFILHNKQSFNQLFFLPDFIS